LILWAIFTKETWKKENEKKNLKFNASSSSVWKCEHLNPNETKKKKGRTKDAQKGGKDTPTFWKGTQNAVLSLK
jgi:hypothetical protein